MFCWNNESGGGRDTGIKDQCILMANNIAKRGGGVDDLPAEAEVIAASATTVGAAAVSTESGTAAGVIEILCCCSTRSQNYENDLTKYDLR